MVSESIEQNVKFPSLHIMRQNILLKLQEPNNTPEEIARLNEHLNSLNELL